MPITRDEAGALAELLCIVRPQWSTRGVLRRGLGPLARHPAPLEVIAWAALRAARDPENLTPAVIPLNGPHWNLADRPPTPRLTPENECPRHIGKWAGNCPECRAEQLGQDDQGNPLTDPDLDHRTAREQARDAARRAQRIGRETTDDQADDDTPDQGVPSTRQPVTTPTESETP